MFRQESLEEISDGRRYGLNDMVRADSNGCRGCAECCETMTDTIILNPLDVCRICRVTGKGFGQLVGSYIELNMHDGVILPNIRSGGSGCVFLSEEKRCTIHENRPDFCRLFPLGRLYENGSYSYILQTGQCRASCSKVKVKKWIDLSDHERYHGFILAWHDLIRAVGERVSQTEDEKEQKLLLMDLLETFYNIPSGEDNEFYGVFYEHKAEFEKRHAIGQI